MAATPPSSSSTTTTTTTTSSAKTINVTTTTTTSLALTSTKNHDINNINKISFLNSVNKINDSDNNKKTKYKQNCHCTNISIMQLFHEMKQEFPTVPDHVVSQCVLDNCHNRPICIDNLRKEALIQPIIQSYPSQILMRNNNNNNNNNNTKCFENNNVLIGASTTTTSNVNIGKLNNNNNNNIKNNNIVSLSDNNNMKPSDMQQQQQNQQTNNSNLKSDTNNDNNKDQRPQRPNTLNFSTEPYNPIAAFVRSGYRPTRSAPPPPTLSSQTSTSSSTASSSSTSTVTPTSHQFHQNINQQSPDTNNDSINVSLNVTVSPVSGRPVRPPRHTTALNLQPEPPFSRDRLLDSPRSYTSVNFTLRQPCVSPQSPIEITAGPGLTYSSSSFDARQGYQSRLQITVGGGVSGGGGSISAMRTRSPRSNNNNNNNNYLNNNNNHKSMSDDDDYGQINGQLRAISMSNESLETCYTPPHKNTEAEIVHRQLVHKQNLLTELEKDKRNLEMMQQEVRELESPLPPDGTSQLKDDITQLRIDCERMVAEVEEAGPYLLGETNEAFYQNIYSGQRLTVQTRPPRPPRPPLPIALRSNSQQHQQNNINNNNNNNLVINHTTSGNSTTNNNINNISNNNNTQNTNNEGPPWICNMCTFQNHPLLNNCEQCEMPQISSGTVIMTNTNLINNNNNNPNNNNTNATQFLPRLQDMNFLCKPSTTTTTTPATTIMSNNIPSTSTHCMNSTKNLPNYNIPIQYQNGNSSGNFNSTTTSIANKSNL